MPGGSLAMLSEVKVVKVARSTAAWRWEWLAALMAASAQMRVLRVMRYTSKTLAHSDTRANGTHFIGDTALLRRRPRRQRPMCARASSYIDAPLRDADVASAAIVLAVAFGALYSARSLGAGFPSLSAPALAAHLRPAG